MVALAVVILISVLALAAPLISPQNPYDLSRLVLMDARRPPGFVGSGGFTHWLGTDAQGRDLLSAILYGLRISIQVGLIAGSIAFALGATLGAFAAYFGGRIEALIMRIIDLQLSFPAILAGAGSGGPARPRQMAADRGTGDGAICLFRPYRPWCSGDRALEGLCRCGALDPACRAARGLPPYPAELPATADCGGHGAGRQLDRAGGNAVLSRAWPAGHRTVAWHADRQRLPVHAVRALLDFDLSRRGADHADRGDQSRRRSDPRPAESEVETMSSLLEVPGSHRRTLPHGRDRSKRSRMCHSAVAEGEIVGLVGESGSGKCVTGFSILGLIDPPGKIVAGSVQLNGRELVGLDQRSAAVHARARDCHGVSGPVRDAEPGADHWTADAPRHCCP